VGVINSPTAVDTLGMFLPHAETIYPAIIILLTALQKTHCDTTLQGEVSTRSLQFAPAPEVTQQDFSTDAGFSMRVRAGGTGSAESLNIARELKDDSAIFHV